MESSLSVLFPVHNAQATLGADVHRMLEVLPDLTHRFDLLIIDDGSTDATFEVGHELTLRYPQVKLVRHARPQGLAEAIRNGLNRTSGEMILVRDAQGGLGIDELPRLWRLRHDPIGIVVPARTKARAANKGWFRRWLPPHNRESLRPVASRGGGFHLLQRHALRNMQTTRGDAFRADQAASPQNSPPPKMLDKLRNFAIGE